MPASDQVAAAHGDQAAFDRLLHRHRTMLRHFAGKWFAPGMTTDDMLQVARIGFWQAVKDFRPGTGASFATFAALCVERHVITAVKTATRKKHGALNYFEAVEDDPNWAPSMVNNPERVVLQRERFRELLRALKWDLSHLEARAVWLVEAEGLSYAEACEILGCGAKTIDNALGRARKKLGVALEPLAAVEDDPWSSCSICLRTFRGPAGMCAECVADTAAALESLRA